MTCKNCKSESQLHFSAKCSDLSHTRFGDVEHEGYVPRGLGIGGGDYINVTICTNCGSIKNWQSLSDEKVKSILTGDE